MKKIYILCEDFLDAKTMKSLNIGGIEVYINNLIPILMEHDYFVTVVQFSTIDIELQMNEGYRVIGLNTQNKKWSEKINILKRYCSNRIESDDIVLYATESLIINDLHNKSISIQHGVYWDKPVVQKENMKSKLIRVYSSYGRIRKLSKVSSVVCVDYNFVNWLRTIDVKRRIKTVVIPNFSVVPQYFEKDDKIVRIIFARRLVEYRGTKLFTYAIEKILNEFEKIEVCIAGEGPDEEFMRNTLQRFDNVSFIKYYSNESLVVHKDKTIAVIPTTGSEGTSLALLEAMASSCAVIATNVGGITNIVIDKYNGLLINPDIVELYESIKLLIQNPHIRKQLSQKAYDTVSNGFSYELWKEKWERVINDIL